jgi:hypothetical protein
VFNFRVNGEKKTAKQQQQQQQIIPRKLIQQS